MAKTALARCAVIGNPIAHSQSPLIHQYFARATGIPINYERILANDENFDEIVHQFFMNGGRGLNITVPFKYRAAMLADHISSEVAQAHSANTLWLDEHGKLWADNTDGQGLVNALSFHQISITHKRVLLIGAGGAASGVYHPLRQAEPQQLDICNRTLEKAQGIIEQQGGHGRAFSLDATIDTPYDLIINATSTGLHSERFHLPQGIIAPHTVCYDMMYGHMTSFMQWAKNHHAAQIFDGYSMLIEQARLSFQHWFHVLPPRMEQP